MSLGLRAQILIALSLVFAVSFAALGWAAVQLSRTAREVEQRRSEQTIAQVLALVVELPEDEQRRVLGEVLERHQDLVLQVSGDAGSLASTGRIPAGEGMGVTLSSGGALRVWLPRSSSEATDALTDLLLFYVLATGGAVLLLTYIALTYLIVRPMDRLTRSSAALAQGAQRVQVSERGAAEVRRLAGAFNDMAAQLRAERAALERRLHELEVTTGDLRSAQGQLVRSEKLASVGRLAAGIAHEIGNPLAAILGLVELLQGGHASTDERAEFLERIHRETDRIQGIIRDLLDYARQGGEAEDSETCCNLANAVDDAVQLVRPQKSLREVQLSVHAPDALPDVVGSQHRLTQVVLNLLLNAADAMNGQGRIDLDVQHEPASGDVLLRVSDSGPGIEPDVIDTLFEPFTTTKAPGEGTGLGLAVCQTLIEGLGGHIEAHNLATGGACFVVRVPSASSSTAVGD